MVSVAAEDLFAEEFAKGIDIFLGGRKRFDYKELEPDERNAIRKCLREGIRKMRRISPQIAADLEDQESAFIKFGGVAKATFPEEKVITYPGEAGMIGVNLLCPQAIRYYATPSSTYPAYTDYTLNKWELDLTAGSDAYLLGSSTELYKASPTTNQHTYIVIAQNGVVEINTSPRIIQMRLEAQGQEGKFSPWVVHPLVEQSIEKELNIYQYNTLGIVPISHDFGVRWKVLPNYTGTSTIKLLGLFFFEFDFMSDTLWIS